MLNINVHLNVGDYVCRDNINSYLLLSATRLLIWDHFKMGKIKKNGEDADIFLLVAH